MKGGIFGFSRREVLGFALFFILSLSLMTFSIIRLISKYYNHQTNTYSQIQKHSHNLWNLQDITLYSVNIQRGSLNLIIYTNNSKEIETVKTSILKNRDRLRNKLIQLDHEDQLEKLLRLNIENAGNNYLNLNTRFLKIASDSVKKEALATYNVNVMRPALRKFTDLTRETGKIITRQIHHITESSVNIFYQFEFWLLILVLSPYFYFFFRFLYLVVKMILWDISS
jgi:hypothetical protein